MGDQLIIGWDKVERTKVDFAQLKIVEKVTHKKYKLGAAAETDNLFLFQMLVRQLAGSDKSLR
jgi:hypothetical protein